MATVKQVEFVKSLQRQCGLSDDESYTEKQIYKECEFKASDEFLEKQGIDGHVIVTPEYFQQVERKAKTFDLILQAIEFHNVLHDPKSFKEDK